MSKAKKLFIMSIICAFMFSAQKANAGVISKGVDSIINGVAQTTYYVTKFTLKASWFLVKKTTKGAYLVSKSIYKGTGEAFKSNKKQKPTDKKPLEKKSIENQPGSNYQTLPPLPPILN
jgi:hypothetical protein